jgi:hypothetical protein
MSVKILPFLACRFLALYAFYEAFVSLASEWGLSAIFYIEADINPSMSHRYNACNVIAEIVFGIFFWLKAEWLSRKITGGYDDYTVATISSEDIQTAGFAVFGLAVMSNAISPFGQFFLMILKMVTLPATLPTHAADLRVMFAKDAFFSLVSCAFWASWGALIFFKAPSLTWLCGRYKKDSK